MRYIILLMCCSCALSETAPSVIIEEGPTIGTTMRTDSGRTIAAFYGLPYAKPPVGDLRFSDPLAPDTWTESYNATKPARPCLQYFEFGLKIFGSEDCLYLNVFTPQIKQETDAEARGKGMDVIVFIHGGVFMFHSFPDYGPGHLLDKDVILVTIQYRVGPLGFLSTGDSIVPGNMGLKDQNMALRWVQRNIKAFGGNPNSVTLAGMSAGAASVHYQMLSPLSQGLFQKAISMSGSALNPWCLAEDIPAKTKKLALSFQCSDISNSTAVIECLRAIEAERIVGFSKSLQSWMYSPVSPWGPVIDTASANPFISKPPMEIIMSGKAADIPWLNTFTSMEGIYPMGEYVFNESLRSELLDKWNEIMPDLMDYTNTADANQHQQIGEKLKEHFLSDASSSHENVIHDIILMASERMFTEGIIDGAKAHARVYKSPIYSYNFTYFGDNSVTNFLCECNVIMNGASHADDLGLVLDAKPSPPHSERDKLMIKKMVKLWTEFAATSTPTWEGIVEWPTVQSSLPEAAVVEISESNARISNAVSNPFWNSLDLQEDSLAYWDATNTSRFSRSCYV